jgi:beta-glucanase (GH16 family)
MAGLTQKLSNKTNQPAKRISLLLFVALIAIAGLLALKLSQASTSFAAGEAEDGEIAGAASVRAEDGASGGSHVRFGAAPNNTGGCMNNNVPAPCIGSATTGADGWGTPVFSDEFNGSALDTDKWAPCWFPDTYPGSDLCGIMNESQTAKSNVKVEDGLLVLTQASRDSGALVSSNPDGGAGTGFSLTTGYYAEARIYFPGEGETIYNWPAWWLNGPESGYGDGEHDIAEGLGTMTVNYHSASGAHNQGTIPGIWSNAFHTYGIHRQADKADIYYDGELVKSYATDDSNTAQYLILNVGTKESREMVYGQRSQVKADYVRVWHKP